MTFEPIKIASCVIITLIVMELLINGHPKFWKNEHWPIYALGALIGALVIEIWFL